MVCRRRGMASRYNRSPPQVTFSTPVESRSSGPSGSSSGCPEGSGGLGPSASGQTSAAGGQHGRLSAGTSRQALLDTNDQRRSPNEYIWRKLEALIERMQSEDTGIPVRNVKSLMTTVPSVFTGVDLVQWLMRHINADDVGEAVHVASKIAGLGYLFPIDDHLLAVKNDAHVLYRFQTPFLYPSRCTEAETADYAVYLCKRTMQNKQRLELADFEAERLASLQNLYYHKWEFIYMQAEAEAKVDKKRDKLERLVLESQERAYWDVHRPVPGCVNTTEVDMRKLCRAKRPKKAPSRPANFPLAAGQAGHLLWSGLDGLSVSERLAKLRTTVRRSRVKVSKAVEGMQSYYDQYSEFDLLLSAAPNVTSGGPAGVNAGASAGSGTNNNNNTAATPSTIGIPGASVPGGVGGQIATAGSGIGVAATPAPAPVGSGLTGSCIAVSGTAGTANSVAQLQDTGASNPWISDNPEYWAADQRLRDLPIRRVKRWSYNIHELIKDTAGREEFQRWLEKEFSAENLRFWQACQDLKGAPLREVPKRVREIYDQFLSPTALEPLNVDSRVADNVRHRVGDNPGANPDRYCFEEAEEHIFQLMKSDSYCRFLRSEVYKDFLAGQKKKSKKRFPSDVRQKLDLD